MNRIILIGNGFDLAHGLKTSYNDFIDWILRTKYDLIKNNHGDVTDNDITHPNTIYSYYDKPYEDFRENFYNNSGIIGYKNNFLELIIRSRYINGWADIEMMFYDELNNLLDNTNTTNKEIDKFNSDFQRIIDLLEEYLLIVVKNKSDTNTNILGRINNLLESNVKEYQLSIEFKNNNNPLSYKTNNQGEEIFNIGEKDVNKCLIIDFNYTQTIYPYLIDKRTRKLKDKFIHVNIHGELKQDDNQMIFGFGDELDENYIKIEKSRIDGVLKYIKSINYLKTDNYRNVLNFLELDKFQVFIWGHSCGLTDRTLLNHIFEHEKCAGIMPYYHKRFNEETKEYSNNYIEIVSNIVRNFTDKNKLRDRVVNFQYCEPLIK